MGQQGEELTRPRKGRGASSLPMVWDCKDSHATREHVQRGGRRIEEMWQLVCGETRLHRYECILFLLLLLLLLRLLLLEKEKRDNSLTQAKIHLEV